MPELNLREIAALLGGDLEGDAAVTIRRVAKIEEAQEGDLTFLSQPKYEKFLETTRASAVLVSRSARTARKDIALIRVDDPYSAVLKVLRRLTPPPEPPPAGVHPSAVVDPSAMLGEAVAVGAHAVIGKRCAIGKGVRLYPNVVIGEDCRIGEDSTLYANVTVRERCTIGSRVILQPGAVIGADGFGFAPDAQGVFQKIPQLGGVVIEDDVEIGANSTIDRATIGDTRICRGAKLDNLVHVAHNSVVGENTVIAAQTGISGSTRIGRNCVIAGQVGFAEHIEIADRIMIAGRSGVSKSFLEPGITLLGYPAKNRREASRQEGALRHLPELRVLVRELEKRIKDLESKRG